MAYLIPPEIFETLEFVVLLVLVGYTLGSALLAVTVKSVYHSVLWLVFTLLGVAMVFLLYAESAILLVVQMIVYAGGITVLMLFAISLSGKDYVFEKQRDWKLLDRRLSFGGAFILFIIAYYLLIQVSDIFWNYPDFTVDPKPGPAELLTELSRQLFTVHGGTVVVLGLLLLAAMLGSVYLVKKEEEDV